MASNMKLRICSNDDNSLMGQCKEVTEVWKAFCGKRSSRRILQRVNISIADGMKPPSIDVLHRVIRGLDEQRQIRQGRLWGKTKANLLAFASTMDAHKALLSFFPSENIYTSVLSGVVSTVVLVRAEEIILPSFQEESTDIF